MADPTDAPAAISWEAATKAIKEYVAAHKLVGVVVEDAASYMTRFGKTASQAIQSAKDAVISFLELNPAITASFDKLKGMLGGAGGDFAKISGEITKSLWNGIKDFGPAAALLSNSFGRTLIDPLHQSGDAVAGLVKDLKEVNDSFRKLLEVQNVARSGFIMLGQSITESDAAAAKYPQTLRVMQGLLGISAKELNEVNKVAKFVPGALNEVAGSVTGINSITGKFVQSSAVAATVLKTFGIEGAAVGTALTDGWLKFNQEAPETIKQMGLLAAAHKATNVDLGTTKQQIESASANLAIFGQGSSAAANVWASFTNTLRGSGVPIKEIGDMVTNLTGKMANMDLNTKAFISTMSGMGGGKSALGGSIQFEMNMRTPGGLEKNLQMLTSTLGQVAGGKIITLQEANRNPQLEGMFTVQRNMLQQQIGGSTEQANRVLEAMQGAKQGSISQTQASQALQDVFNKGVSIQDGTMTAIDKLEATVAPGVQSLGNIDTLMTTLTNTLVNGSKSKRQRDAGERGGLSDAAATWAAVPSTDKMGRPSSSQAIPLMNSKITEVLKEIRNLPSALLKAAKDVVEPRGGRWAALAESARPARPRDEYLKKEDTTPEKKEQYQLAQPAALAANVINQRALEDILSTLNQKQAPQVMVPEEKNTDNRKTTISENVTNSEITIHIKGPDDYRTMVADAVKKEAAIWQSRASAASRNEPNPRW